MQHDGGLGATLARVGEDTISVEELQSFCAATGKSPRESLERLVAERLLAAYAEQRGYGELPSVRRGVEQARVRALLAREIERPGSPEQAAARRDAVDHLLSTLAKATPVHYDEAAIRRAFAPSEP